MSEKKDTLHCGQLRTHSGHHCSRKTKNDPRNRTKRDLSSNHSCAFVDHLILTKNGPLLLQQLLEIMATFRGGHSYFRLRPLPSFRQAV